MLNLYKNIKSEILSGKRTFRWLATATGVLLLIPLIAMQFTSEVNWDLFDFIVIGALIFSIGSLFIFTARKVKKRIVLLAFLFFVVFIYIWAELAVGIFTNLGS